jgi:nucleoside-diphosphate-sugar epimerase
VRVFVAGASGVIGTRVTQLLVARGDVVIGTTRHADRAPLLAELGAEPVVCDVFDAPALRDAVVAAAPDVVMHQLTDLPDDVAALAEFAAANARIRREGTRNLLDAAAQAGVRRLIAQSVAWRLPGDAGEAVTDLERMVLAASGVVVRYGQFYGPGTYHESAPSSGPRIAVDDAARRTLEVLEAPSGVVTIVED